MKSIALAALALVVGALPLGAAQRFAKDVGPQSAACDTHEKGSAAWTACVGAAKTGMPDHELFYAGYWLAKTGRYAEALGYLALADQMDERVLTYTGFATRKLGDLERALPLYGKALEINPEYFVARAYLGEAYLTKGEPEKAEAQLREIGVRCGTTCAAYLDLAGQIKDWAAARGKAG